MLSRVRDNIPAETSGATSIFSAVRPPCYHRSVAGAISENRVASAVSAVAAHAAKVIPSTPLQNTVDGIFCGDPKDRLKPGRWRPGHFASRAADEFGSAKATSALSVVGVTGFLACKMHRRSLASEGTSPKATATRRASVCATEETVEATRFCIRSGVAVRVAESFQRDRSGQACLQAREAGKRATSAGAR